ncbi:MAG: response regulator [Anaerolineales bacterium]
MQPNTPIQRNCYILLVEDNPVDADLAKRAFSKGSNAISFALARDGEEALKFIPQWDAGAHLPTFILLDLKLPKVDGLQVLRELKTHPKYRVIPIIVLTSSSEERDLQMAYELGANSYIVKEIDYDKFSKTAAEIKSYWCYLNVIPQKN